MTRVGDKAEFGVEFVGKLTSLFRSDNAVVNAGEHEDVLGKLEIGNGVTCRKSNCS